MLVDQISKHIEGLNLSEEEMSLLTEMINETTTTGQSPIYESIVKPDWKENPVSGKQFIEDPEYFGLFYDTVYPGVVKDFISIIDQPVPVLELILTGALRWGKSFLVALIIGYHIYRLGCMRNPQSWLGLASTSFIYIINLSVTGEQAKEGILAELRNMVDNSPWFSSNFRRDHRVETILRFPNNIVCKSGNSSEFSAIGKNVYIGVVDESNFFGVKKKSKKSIESSGEYDAAKVLYSALVKRIRLTYTNKGIQQGLGVIASSSRYPQDFIEKKIQFIRDLVKKKLFNGDIAVKRHSVWEVNPEKFSAKTFRVEVGDGGTRPRIIDEEALENDPAYPPIVTRIIDVPVDLRIFFEDDIDMALRDLAGISTSTLSPFFKNKQAIKVCFASDDTRYVHPFKNVISIDLSETLEIEKLCTPNRIGKFSPIFNSKSPRGIALDLSKAGEGNDPTGFAMGHVAGYKEMLIKDPKTFKEDKISAPIIRVDLVLRIRAVAGGELEHEKILKLIFQLRLFGFNINFVVADQYQSHSILQQVRKKNIDAFVKSTREHEYQPYHTWKRAVTQGRFVCYPYSPLYEEMNSLEDQAGIIDHPPEGYNDVSDAVANMVDELSNRFFSADYKTVPVVPEQEPVDFEETDKAVLEYGLRYDMGGTEIDPTLKKVVDLFVYQNLSIPWDRFSKEECAIVTYLLTLKSNELGDINRYGQSQKCLQEIEKRKLLMKAEAETV